MSERAGLEAGRSRALNQVVLGALCAGAAWAILFADLSGKGSLVASLGEAAREMIPQARPVVSARVYLLPAKAEDEDVREQNEMLMVPDDSGRPLRVMVEDRPVYAVAAAPAPAYAPQLPGAPRPGLDAASR